MQGIDQQGKCRSRKPLKELGYEFPESLGEPGGSGDSQQGGSRVHSAGGTNRVVHRIDVGMENRHQSLL